MRMVTRVPRHTQEATWCVFLFPFSDCLAAALPRFIHAPHRDHIYRCLGLSYSPSYWRDRNRWCRPHLLQQHQIRAAAAIGDRPGPGTLTAVRKIGALSRRSTPRLTI